MTCICSVYCDCKWIRNVFLLLSVILFSGCHTSLDDISPEKANGVSQGSSSPAGLIIAITGTRDAVYAVSPNAGIWKNAMDENRLFGAWTQLQASPRYSNCIAVDPLNNQHIVVGERNGDAINSSDNKCGVWESFDGGTTFPKVYYFDPSMYQAVLPDNLRNQLITSAIFTPQRTILVATTYGIARKAIGTSKYDFSHSPSSSLITALATFDDYILARDEKNIYISNSDGTAWATIPIPPVVDDLNVTWNARGDLFSIAGMKNIDGTKFFVYLSFKPTNDVGNKNSILIYDMLNNVWHSQLLVTRDGTGIGGRRFIKSFNIRKKPKQIGYGDQLIYCGAQELMQATGIDNNGIPTWKEFMQGRAAGPYTTPNDDVHSDIWDFHINPSGPHAFVACDGGIFADLPFSESPKWTSLNSGLHTQHIHSLVTSFNDGLNTIAYATSDNGCWVNQQANSWNVFENEGDANWVVNDQGNGNKLLSARHFQKAELISFPSLTSTPITINNDLTFPTNQIQCIQTLTSEAPQTSLDVVMLANLPLQYEQAKLLHNVPGIVGLPNARGGSVLLRNKHFELNADINLSMGKGWEILSDNLPAGTTAFWISGGHSKPQCYVYAVVNKVPGIYKRVGISTKGTGTDSWIWTRLDIDNVNPPAEYGPLFVNPYDTKILYVATSDGVFVSGNGGMSFFKDITLTDLISASGTYSISGTFSGGNGISLPGTSATHANPMCPLSCMAFDRESPGKVVAASPFTGVFYKHNALEWKDLSRYLPRPFTPISTIAISKSDIYIGTEGRGLLRINNY